ncbi:MAG TPA: DegT/DnrJ/EryC1/StrS family aminotransferase [Chryseolinea sp.]
MTSKSIPFLSLAQQHARIRTEALEALTNVYDRNWFVLGKELEMFEQEYARFSHSSFCVGVGNGLDALFIALKACSIGQEDEVIVPAHTFLATWLAVSKTGAKIVPIEPDPETFNIDVNKLADAITSNTKAVVPVHLYGQSCDMTGILSLTRPKSILVVEDNAQAHGATWNGKPTGSLGDCSATSFYPVKNLGALGDGGAIVTHNYELAQYAMRYRNYGFEKKSVASDQGTNSRLDELQAAFLRIKLKYLQSWNNERVKIAAVYLKNLEGVGDITLPKSVAEARHVYHLFVIRTSQREALQKYLSDRSIETAVHYPIPPHLQKGLMNLGFKKGDFPITERIADTALSLPLWPGMEPDQVDYVCDIIKKFY